MGTQENCDLRVLMGHPGDAGVSQVLPLGPPGHTVQCSFIRVTVEPLGDTVVALTLSDGCSTDTQMSLEYLMVVALILQNLMVAPTVTLVRPTGDTVVTQWYPSIPTVSQCDYSIAALLPMLPAGPPEDIVETLGYLSITTVSHCASTVD